MKNKIIYPEMLEYPWAKELEYVTKNTKRVKGGGSGLLSELPKVPVNFVLAVMKDAYDRPEVMAAFGIVPVNAQIPRREGHLIMWFKEYLEHKYGNQPDPIMLITLPLRKLANGEYKGLDDRKLRKDLLRRPLVCKDDGVKYD